MIGLVLVTHGNLARELIATTEHVVGPQTAIIPVCIGPDDNLDNRCEDIKQAIETVDSGNGVIILTDMFGGTPSNLATSFLKSGSIEVLTGVNLPMLVRLAGVRENLTLNEGADKGYEAAKKYIHIVSRLLKPSP